MNVVHLGVGGAIPVPPGDKASGTERFIFNLTDSLGRLGCDISVIDIASGRAPEKKRRQSAARFYEVWHPPLPGSCRVPLFERIINYLLLMSHLTVFSLAAGFTLFRLLGRKRVDILHFHSNLPALAGILLNKLKGNRAVTIYHLYTGFPKESLSWRKRVPALPEFLAMKWADHTVTISPADRQWLISEFHLSPVKVTAIFASAEVTEVNEYLGRQEGPVHQSRMVLGVGTISSRKNQLSAVKAIPLVTAKNPDVKFVFAGLVAESGYYDEMNNYIKKNHLSPWVDFTGEISREKLYRLYRDAVVFLFPTTAESQGIVVLEAMAFGLPVIASRIGPIQDMVGRAPGSAILVDPYDVEGIATAVNRLLGDGPLRDSMAQKGKELARLFSHGHIAKEMLDLYNRLLRDRRQTDGIHI